MANVTAGVSTREIDISLYTQQLSGTIFGQVNSFTKGPVNKPTFISSEPKLTEIFGPPTPNSQGFYAAREFLRRGNQLQVVRVGNPSTMAKATATAVASGPLDSIRFDSINEGSGWNGIKLVLTSGSASGRKISITTADGILLEQYDNITRANAVANINGISKYVTATILTAGSPGEPTNQSITLSAGTDGISGLTDSHVIGTSGVPKTGLQLLKNPEVIDLNLIAASGFSSSNVILELLSLAEFRADTLALIDPPFGLDVTQVRDWHNGLSPGDVAFNSSYGALYWSWQQAFDEYNSQNVYTAPSGHVSRVIAFTDATRFPWFAPAGLQRGRVPASKGGEYSPDQGERDYLSGPGQNVNSIVDFIGLGPTVFSQKTLQRAPTALDRVNVRRMLLHLRKVIATSAKYLSFEPNDPTTWREFTGLVTPPVRNVLTNRGIRDFRVICDGTTNTADVIDQNRMRGKIYVKPTKSAEMIEIDFITTAQGADFNEVITQS